MPKAFRTSLLAALALASLAEGGHAQTQETNGVATNTVGNPQLRDFQLPGDRTTPPQPAPPIVSPPPAATPPAQIEAPPRPTPPAPTRQPVARPPITDGTNARPERQEPPQREADPEQRPVAPLPQAVEQPEPVPAPSLPSTSDAAPAAPETMPLPQAGAEPASSRDELPWLPILLGAAAALLAVAAAAFMLRRRRERAEAMVEIQAPATENPPPALDPLLKPRRSSPPVQPASRPEPVASPPAKAADPGIVGIQMRPWIELEFKPARAAATLTEANVQFELILRNTGSAPARNVRIEVRMFNAGPEQEREIELFYGEPIRERTPPALDALPARGEVQVTSAVAMPNDNVREITVQGRRLFIPTVAFNVVYDWGNGKSGQTSTSYLVGREAETPTAKMGAFRLDLGPRLYRSVGQRQTRLARIV